MTGILIYYLYLQFYLVLYLYLLTNRKRISWIPWLAWVSTILNWKVIGKILGRVWIITRYSINFGRVKLKVVAQYSSYLNYRRSSFSAVHKYSIYKRNYIMSQIIDVILKKLNIGNQFGTPLNY